MLLIFVPSAETIGLTVVVGIFTSLLGALGVILAARYGFLGKREESKEARMARLEAREELCQEKLYKLRTIVTTLVMGQDIMIRACPDAEKEVRAAQQRMREQLRELEVLDEEDPHTTQAN